MAERANRGWLGTTPNATRAASLKALSETFAYFDSVSKPAKKCSYVPTESIFSSLASGQKVLRARLNYSLDGNSSPVLVPSQIPTVRVFA
jgi:hypothetical protein